MTFRTCSFGLAFALLALAACDLPTTSPEWETRWVVPADETTIGVAEFLPDGVRVASGGSAFEVDIETFAFSESLGALCGMPCQLLDGQTVPKPPFTKAFEASTTFAEDVVTVDVVSGDVLVQATNGFNFDPIRPGMGNFGLMTLTLYDGAVGGRILDQIVVDGATESFAPGSTLTRTLSVTGEVSATVTVELSLSSPLGDPFLIDVTDRIDVIAAPGQILVASAVVNVAGQEVSVDPSDLNVEDIDDQIVDRVQSARSCWRSPIP